MSEPDDDPLIGATIADRYRIEKRLGQGGMGAVYLAEHVRMRKPFAVKVLHKEMGRLAEAVYRFEREAVAAGRVDHENLVTATDFGQLADDSLYLVLEYVPGTNLAALLAEGRVATRRALGIARQIASALGAIHAVGIVHRDVKPDNVMLVERSGDDFVKLLDFGMAKVHFDAPPEERQVTRTGFVFGTPRYMAPEQAAGEQTDHRADIYALGIILYAMLAGSPPFSADEIRDVLRMQRFDPPPPLPEDVPPEVAALVMRLLAKDPNERVQTADGVIEYIDRLIAQLAAKPRGRRATVALFLRTRAGIAAAAGAACVAFLATFVVVHRSSATKVPAAVPAPVASLAKSAKPPVPKTDATLDRAEVGDTAAWRALEARPDAGRSAREWFVLGEARTVHGDLSKGLDAYLRAAEIDGRYASHPRVLRDLSVATHSDAWEAALRIAAALPGSHGADILFDVWASDPKSTPTTRRARNLLVTDATRSRETEAVRVAFDLRSAQGQPCEVRRPIVVRAAAAADTRALHPLLILAARSGCGSRRRSDCFPCLRSDDTLARAIDRAKNTPAPDYLRVIAAR